MRVLCLANSIREGGRCVAGIELATGRWVRPVPADGGPIPYHSTFRGHKFLEPGDLVDVDVDDRPTPMPFQRENHLVRGFRWRIERTCRPSEYLHLCETTEPLFHNEEDRVEVDFLQGLGVEQWRSLQLIRPSTVQFQRDHRDSRKWRAVFPHGRQGTLYALRVTDTVCTSRLNAGESIVPDCLLTVSLTVPWTPPEGGPPVGCFKLVAAVIELDS